MSTEIETPVAIELVRNGLAAIADEMAITQVRAAYSSVVRDMLDFSTAVTDGQGRVLAQGLSLALQLGAIPRFMRYVLRGIEQPAPGDVYLVNHPWQGGVHLPDFLFARPVFLAGEDEPIAYTVIVSHMVDVGGRFPGGVSVEAGSIWEEGLVIPLVPLVSGGVTNRPLLELIGANTREPVKVLGDVRAVLAGLETGERQVRELAQRFGGPQLRRSMHEFLEYTERATRAALERIPDGSGSAVDYLDDDGAGGPPVRFECRAEKRGGSLHFDFTGTDLQVPSSINCTVADIGSVVAFVARAALGEDVVVNDGFTRCVDFTIPDGTVASAQPPAAVASRAASIYRLTDVAMAALAELVPERVPANDGGPIVIYFSGHRADGTPWIFLDYVQAGWGATAGADGVPGVSHPISNAGNIPGEVLEDEYPLRLVSYGLVPDTAGAGRHVGAPAVRREYEVLADETTGNFRVERRLHPPQGRLGGGPGSPSRCQVRRKGGGWDDLPSKWTGLLAAGDRVRIQLAAGGGFGDPAERSAEALERDRRNGLVTLDEVTA